MDAWALLPCPIETRFSFSKGPLWEAGPVDILGGLVENPRMDYPEMTHGEYAARFPDYRYRKALRGPINPAPVDHRLVDPPNPYPRYLIPPGPPAVKIIDVVDYVIKMDIRDGFRCAVELWVLPGAYTLAKDPKLVCSFCADSTLGMDFLKESARFEAFGATRVMMEHGHAY